MVVTLKSQYLRRYLRLIAGALRGSSSEGVEIRSGGVETFSAGIYLIKVESFARIDNLG